MCHNSRFTMSPAATYLVTTMSSEMVGSGSSVVDMVGTRSGTRGDRWVAQSLALGASSVSQLFLWLSQQLLGKQVTVVAPSSVVLWCK